MGEIVEWFKRLAGASETERLLIEKVSRALGMVYEPTHVRRMAEAEADSMRTLATAEADVSDIRVRAELRQKAEQVQYQQAIEEITIRALPHLKGKSGAEKVDDDWVRQFFGIAREVTNSEMRSLWARILAGEFNNPGSFTRRTLRIVGDMDRADATLLHTLYRCAFLGLPVSAPFVWDHRAEIYKNLGLNFNALTNLEAIGLIKFDNVRKFQFEHLDTQMLRLRYWSGEFMDLAFPKSQDNAMPMGTVMPTRAGIELSSLCDACAPVDGFLDYVEPILSGWAKITRGFETDTSS